MAKKPSEEQKVVRHVLRSPDFKAYYANETQIQTGPWDVRLVFSTTELDEADSVRTLTSRQVAEVRMSHQMAMTVVEILTGQLKGFEQKVGKIPMPPRGD